MEKEKIKFLKHTADVKFQVSGENIKELFENSAIALKQIITKNIIPKKIKNNLKKIIITKGKDYENLLYKFLEEFLYLLDAENFLFSEINSLSIIQDKKDIKLKAEVLGDDSRKYKFTNNVKAVTYNEMFVKQDKKNKSWKAQVVIDV